MKYLLTIMFSAAFLHVSTLLVEAKTALLCTGIFGEIVAPMNDYVAPLQKKGYQVLRGNYIYPINAKPDVVISHSACADVAPTWYPKARHYPLDGTWLGRGCPQGTRCDNYYAPINKYPFFLCCGGYPTRGSTTTTKVNGTLSFFIWAPGHVTLPSRVRDRVINSMP